MAKKPTKKRASTPSQTKSETHVTRITAGESTKKPSNVKQAMTIARKTRADKKPAKKQVASDSDLGERRPRNPLAALLGYFKGSWYELRQVRWPDRRSTWSMTGALLLFTGFFVVFVVLIDALFKYLFQLIIG